MNGEIRFNNLSQLYDFIIFLSQNGGIQFNFAEGEDAHSFIELFDDNDIDTFKKLLDLPEFSLALKHGHLTDIFERVLEIYLMSYEDYYKQIVEIILQRYLDDKKMMHIATGHKPKPLVNIGSYGYEDYISYIHLTGSTLMKDALVKSIDRQYLVTNKNKLSPYNPLVKLYEVIKIDKRTTEEWKANIASYKAIVYDIMDRINTNFFKDFLPKNIKDSNFMKEYAATRVMDTAMGLRGAGLPSLAVENIASHAYDTTGFNLYQLMSMIQPVNEGPAPKPGVIGAGRTTYDEKEYSDVQNIIGAGENEYDEQEYIDL